MTIGDAAAADELLSQLDTLRVDRQLGTPATYQQAFLLWAIGRAASGQPRLTHFSGVEPELWNLLRPFAVGSTAPDPASPWAALGATSWWESGLEAGASVPGRRPRDRVRDNDPVGGLRTDVYRRLQADASFRAAAIEALRRSADNHPALDPLLSHLGLVGAAPAPDAENPMPPVVEVTQAGKPLNPWWDDDPRERYWLEVTDREDLGADLHAPKLDDAGRPYWSYNLVTEVRDDDIVLHWHKSLMRTPGIVGWSTASGRPENSTILWQARGTYGRAHGPTGREPAWRMPLTGYTPLLTPIDQDVLRREEPALRAIHARLAAEHGNRPLYFPFAFSDRRPIRTSQGYLFKFPAALLDVFPELARLPAPSRRRQPGRSRPRPGREPGDAVGIIADLVGRNNHGLVRTQDANFGAEGVCVPQTEGLVLQFEKNHVAANNRNTVHLIAAGHLLDENAREWNAQAQ